MSKETQIENEAQKSVFETIEESIIAEFNEFEKAMLENSKKTIFDECLKIHFYSELCGYIQDMLHEDFEEEDVALLSNRNDILFQLFGYYNGNDYSSISSYEDDRELIEDYIKEEKELEAQRNSELMELIEKSLKEGTIQERDGKYTLFFSNINGKDIEWETKEDILKDLREQISWGDPYVCNVKSEEYLKYLYEAMHNSKAQFPELYRMIFGISNDPDLFFSKGPDEHKAYYFNPDSSAGGQIVEIPFDDEMARRVIEGEDFIDVAAEVTQYLSDINTVNFFSVIEDMITLRNEYSYIGKAETEEARIDIMKKLLERN